MAAQEITLKFRGDESQIKASLAGLRSAYSSTLADITRQTRQEAAAAASLQRQRSTALITIWKADTRTVVNEEKRRTADAAREERERMRASLALQRQRSAALIAQWKAEQREQIRIARETEREQQRVATEARRAVASTGGTSAFLAGAVGGLSALVGVSVINEIRQAGQAWLDYSSKLETTRIAFTTMLGSAQAANAHLKELQQFALKTPFQFSELIDASQRMQALGFNASQVIPILTDVGNAVAAAGGGSERLDRVVLALSQMQSKGKVATQELNQLAEAGISGFKILEQALGKSRAELVKMVEAGEISSKVFLDAFQKFSQQNFGGLMEEQSRTFTGAMSNIKDALLQTSAVAFEPLFKKLSDTARHFSEASQSSEDFKKKAQEVGKVVSTVWDGAVAVINAVKDAYRLAVAVIFVALEKLVNGFEAVGHAVSAVIFNFYGLARAAQGDFRGAMKFQEEAIRELRLSHESLGKALFAEVKLFQEVVKIYNEAGAAAKRLKDERAGMTVGFEIGPAFQRKVGVDVGSFPDRVGETGLEKKTKGSDPAAAAKRIAEIQLRAVLDGIQLEEEGIERSLRRREIEYAEYVVKLEVLEGQRSRSVIEGLIEEQKAANQLRDANARDVATAEITARLTQEKNRHQSELNKISDKTFERDKQIHEALTGFQEQQIEQLRQLIDGNKTALDQVNDFVVAYTKLGGVLDANQTHWLRFNAALIQSKENIGKLLDAIRESPDLVPAIAPEGVPELTEEQKRGNILTPEDQARLGAPPELTLWEQFGVALREIIAGVRLEMVSLGEFMSGQFKLSFLEMGDALKQGIVAWLIYGESLGKALRKALAASLAHIAADAAIQALYHLAFAIGKLAFGDGAGASLHFVAAAKFGAVAAAAGVGSRLVAGSAFSSTVAGSKSSGSSSQNPNQQAQSSSPQTVELNRTALNNQALVQTLEFKVKGDVIVDEFIRDYDLNGRTRIKITTDR